MQIAQVVRIPQSDSSWQRAVWWLTEELVLRGHQVSLVQISDRDQFHRDQFHQRERWTRKRGSERPASGVYATGPLAALTRNSRPFDLIHVHGEGPMSLPARFEGAPVVLTIHDDTISKAGSTASDASQAAHSPLMITTAAPHPTWRHDNTRWMRRIPDGVPEGYVACMPGGSGLAYIGPIRATARIDRAIRLAHVTGSTLHVAGKLRDEERGYFERAIAPHVDGTRIQFHPNPSEQQRYDILGKSQALVLPSRTHETRSLTAVEALATGTPIISFAECEMEDFVVNGTTGFIVDDLQGAAAAVSAMNGIERAACRAHFERHLSAGRMTESYLEVYGQVSERTFGRADAQALIG